MSVPGRGISAAMSNRWGFEALGRALDLDAVVGSAHAQAFTGSPSSAWLILAGTAVALTAATVAVLARRTRTN